MVAYRQRRQENAIPSLVSAIRAYGDEFYAQLNNQRKAARRAAREAAMAKHRDKFGQAYEDYLTAQEEWLRCEHPDSYRPFEQSRATERKRLVKSSRLVTNMDSLLGLFDSEKKRKQDFCSFFLGREPGVLDFWDWDAELNPSPLRKATQR